MIEVHLTADNLPVWPYSLKLFVVPRVGESLTLLYTGPQPGEPEVPHRWALAEVRAVKHQITLGDDKQTHRIVLDLTGITLLDAELKPTRTAAGFSTDGLQT